MIEHARDRQMNTVGGRAIDEVKTVGRLPQRQRPIEGERVARAAAIALGRDHGCIAKVVQGVGQGRKAGREIAVVVTEENAHR